eukprot:1382430-Prymnesium_polylepis.1
MVACGVWVRRGTTRRDTAVVRACGAAAACALHVWVCGRDHMGWCRRMWGMRGHAWGKRIGSCAWRAAGRRGGARNEWIVRRLVWARRPARGESPD